MRAIVCRQQNAKAPEKQPLLSLGCLGKQFAALNACITRYLDILSLLPQLYAEHSNASSANAPVELLHFRAKCALLGDLPAGCIVVRE